MKITVTQRLKFRMQPNTTKTKRSQQIYFANISLLSGMRATILTGDTCMRANNNNKYSKCNELHSHYLHVPQSNNNSTALPNHKYASAFPL